MSFLTPLAFLGALIIGPIIVAMYLLKLRREERTVSSTFLWQRMVRDVEANAPWQKLRRNLLLLLQLLLLLLLIFALARPFFQTTGIAGHNLIVIIDRSASMAATDVDSSRLEAAKQQAVQLIDQLPDGGRATVIAAGGQMDVPVAATTDRRQMRQAIDGITLRNGGGSDLSQALTLASALAAREADSEVVIISDGNVTLPADLKVPATVRYFPIGAARGNVAVSALALQTSAAGQTLFAQATNYGPEAVTRRMDVYLDGALFNAYNLDLQAGRDQSVVVDVPASVRVAEARLSDDAADALPLDNQAWVASSAGESTEIRLMTPGNRFLTTALDLLPGLKVTQVPTSTATFTETTSQIPLTILDRVTPAALPPGNLLFIGPLQSTEFFSVTGLLEFPSPRPAAGDDALLRNVSLSDISIAQAAKLTPSTWARVVVDSDGGPLILAGERDGRRIVVIAFDLRQSDLPLQVAFPLLMSNIISYLAPGAGADASLLTPDQPLAVNVDQAVSDVRVTKPDGSVVSLPITRSDTGSGQAIFADTDALGVYVVEQYAENELLARQRYTVNLFSPTESTITRKEELNVPQVSGLQQARTGERVGRQEVWRWLAAAALVILVVEWLVYQRNGIAYLRDRFRAWRRAST